MRRVSVPVRVCSTPLPCVWGGLQITHYVQHPVPLEPPAEAPPPPPQPLKLTKAELKKLRTQRRSAREKEKQELIRQGAYVGG